MKPRVCAALLFLMTAGIACVPQPGAEAPAPDPTTLLQSTAPGPVHTAEAAEEGASESSPGPARQPTPTPLPVVIVPDFRAIDFRGIPDYFASIPPEGIAPIYAPQFVNAADAPLDPGELVLGYALDGEAKAYPISVLRFREIVNDELAGLPILVTW